MKIKDESTIENIEFVLNHPDVFSDISLGLVRYFDGREMFDSTLPLWFDNGGFLLQPTSDPTTFEVHTAFMPESRGAYALACAREAEHWLFSTAEILRLVTKVQRVNKKANFYTRSMGFRKIGIGNDFIIFEKNILDWVLGDSKLEALGREYLECLPESSNIDTAAFKVLGAYISMRRDENYEKAFNVFNFCSRLLMFPLMDSHDPESFTIANTRFVWEG